LVTLGVSVGQFEIEFEFELWPKKYSQEVGADQQNDLRYWTKYAGFRASFSGDPLSP